MNSSRGKFHQIKHNKREDKEKHVATWSPRAFLNIYSCIMSSISLLKLTFLLTLDWSRLFSAFTETTTCIDANQTHVPMQGEVGSCCQMTLSRRSAMTI